MATKEVQEKQQEKQVDMSLDIFMALVYEAFSEMLQRGDMFGLQPKQNQIDQIWVNELQPKIMYRVGRVSKAKEGAKNEVAQSKEK
jgi:hypothetical protein